MSSRIFEASKVQFLDDNGSPLRLGRITFFEAGTSILKSVYADHSLATPLSNPISLDAGGFTPASGIWLGSGPYGYKVEKNIGGTYVEVYSSPYIDGGQTSASGADSVTYVSSLAQLQALSAGVTPFVFMAGYYSAQDRGGGYFAWAPLSVASADNGAIVSPLSNPTQGRWIRIFDCPASISMWGACSNTGTNCSPAIMAATTYTANNGMDLYFDAKEVQVEGVLEFGLGTGNYVIEGGFSFKKLTTSATVTLSPKSLEVQGGTSMVGPSVTLVLNPKIQIDICPEYFGAVGDGSTDDYNALKMASYSTGRKVFSQVYKALASGAGGTPSLSFDRAYFKKGSRLMCLVQTSITSMDAEKGALWVLQGDAGYSFSNVSLGCVPHAHWLFNLTPNSTEANSAIDLAVRANPLAPCIIWDYEGTFVIPSGLTASSILHQIEAGTILKMADVVAWGQIQAGSYRIYDLSGAGYMNAQKMARLAWFGPYLDSSHGSANALALTRSLLSLNGFGVLDCEAIPLDIGGSTIDASLNGSGQVIKNLVLSGSSTAPFVSITGRIKAQDWSVSSVSLKFYNPMLLERVASTHAIGLYDPSTTQMNACDCTNLVIDGTSSGFVVAGLRVVGNSFNAILGGANLAASGHKADVYGNLSKTGTLLKATKYDYWQSATKTLWGGSVTLGTMSSIAPSFLPYGSTPMAGCAVIDSVMVSGANLAIQMLARYVDGDNAIYGTKWGTIADGTYTFKWHASYTWSTNF